MAAGQPAAPWLHPPDVTGNYLHGFGLGEQAASENARLQQAQAQLQQHAQQAQMELEQRKAEHERQTLMQQQQMEVQKAYQQAQIGMAQQKLQEAQKVNQMKIKQAADMGTARMSYDKEMRDIDSNPDLTDDQRKKAKSDTAMRLMPQMVAASGAGLGTAVSAAQKMAPLPQTKWQSPDTTTGAPGAMIDPRGVPHFPPKQGQSPEATREAAEYKKELDVLGNLREHQAAYAPKSTTFKSYQTQIDAAQKRLDALNPGEAKSPSGKQKLDESTAMWFLNEARGDKDAARKLAKEAGYEF